MLPLVPGLPWWGAVLLAVIASAIGFAIDAGSGTKSLSGTFVVCYVTGCVLAVLAVRQSSLFTTVIQPPLLLFVAVPSAYFLMHSSEIKGMKDILINCGYPLIERFPLMFFTAVTVLAIGVARWYLHRTAQRHAPQDVADDVADEAPSKRRSRRTTVVDDADEDPPAKAPKPARAPRAERADRPDRTSDGRRSRRHSIDRDGAYDDDSPRPRKARPAGSASRARHTRPPETEIIDAVPPPRPRRTRPPVDPESEPRRRPRSDDARERRDAPPVARRSTGDRSERAARSERPVRRDRSERYERPEGRSERRSYRDSYESRDSYEPFEGPVNGTPSSNGRSHADSTHHPVSRVRYRGSDDEDPRAEHRTRPRRSRDAWDSED